MRRAFVIGVVVLVTMLCNAQLAAGEEPSEVPSLETATALVAADLPGPPPNYDPDGPDQDCRDFADEDKPFALPEDDDDRHDLDRDNDRIACEPPPTSEPSESESASRSPSPSPSASPSPSPSPSPPATPSDGVLPSPPARYNPAGPDQDCADFTDAEKPFMLPPGDTDPHGLDADDDRIACEDGRQVTKVPKGGVETGAGGAARPGASPAAAAFGVAGTLLAGVAVRRRLGRA